MNQSGCCVKGTEKNPKRAVEALYRASEEAGWGRRSPAHTLVSTFSEVRWITQAPTPTPETLTHLSVFHKEQADGVLAAEVKDVNVVLDGNLRE